MNVVARPSGGFTARGFAASGAAPETHAFQAETRRLLDIVTNSLYTDKEVFVRELVSNASDALEKCRHEFLVRGQDPGSLTIDITTDEEQGTFSIADTGLGMSKDDLIANLGVIARSGSRAFVEEIDGSSSDDSIQKQKQTDASSAKSIIGKFGVGFYSAFMVSDRVEVFSNKGDGDGAGGAHKWSSAGDGEFSVAECAVGDGPDEAPRRGTRIVLHVKDSEKALATSAWSVEAALRKHSAFVGFPVTLNGKRANAVDALWTKTEKEVSDEDANAFYRFVGGGGSASETFTFRLHFSADAPLTVRALLFAPSENPERGFGGAGALSENAGGVALYSRRVLIQQNARNVLPNFLRFIRGVIDCEDVPLNISRETPQDTVLVRKLGEIVAKRVIKWLTEKAKREPQKYTEWYGKLGVFLKEGICGDESYLYKDALVPLLRFESSLEKEGANGEGAGLTSLDAYIERMPTTQKEVYYLVAPGGRKQAESSPYLEAARARGYEVLFLYAHVDEFVMQHVRRHRGKDLVSAEAATFEAEETSEESKDGDESEASSEKKKKTALSAEKMSSLCDWFATEALPGRVTGVSTSARLVSAPALLTGHEPEAMRRYRAMLTMMSDEATAAKLDELKNAAALELNPKHAIIKGIERLRRDESEEKVRIAKLLAEQVFDNARVAAGALDDPREMVGRIHEILEVALHRVGEDDDAETRA
jgi:TNF receptor-associated protein 1